MPTKELGTLLADIQGLFEGTHEVSEENLDLLANGIKETLRRALTESGTEQEQTLRMSNLGTPDRKLWYSFKHPEMFNTETSWESHLNFCYGHLLEEFLLFLVRESGHEVTHEQEEIEVDGIKGHLDCCIDGVPVDIKSASEYGFKKFIDGSLLQGVDPFGYMHQISGYANAMGSPKGAFLAINKNKGQLALLTVEEFFLEDTEARISNVRTMLDSEEMPERCYEEEPFGKSGNMKIPMPCIFCPFKFKCWPKVRIFQYSSGLVYLTNVSKTPNVPEVTDGYKDQLKPSEAK